jgi:hypothetical protein
LLHLLVFHLTLVGAASPADVSTHAKILDGDHPAEVLFNYSMSNRRSGLVDEWKATFRDPMKQEVASELTSVKEGRLLAYKLTQPLQQEEAEIQLTDKGTFFRYSKNGKWEENLEAPSGEVIAPPQIIGFALRHWEKIESGEKVSVRLAVPDRLETIGFRYQKSLSDDPKETKIEFVPSSFIIRQFVKPIEMRFETSSRKIRSFRAPSFLKKKEGTRWVSFLSEFRFD